MRSRAASTVVATLAVALVAACGGGEGPSRKAGDATTPRPAAGAPAARLGRALDEAFAGSGSPGLAVAVTARDWTWSGGRGVVSIRRRRPVSARTAFGLGGMTNTFVAALALRLAEDGRLRLDDPVARWLPGVRLARGVTVRDLLAHTSGIAAEPDAASEPLFAHPRRAVRRTWLAGWVRATGKRGTFVYSNVNYALAGQVIEKASGTTAARALHTAVLDGAGLRTMALQPQERPPASAAHGHAYPEGSAVDISDGTGAVPLASIASAAWTAGGLVGSAEDVARFGHALFSGRIVGRASLRQMTRFEEELALWEGYGLGLGRQSLAGHDVWGHEGQMPGFHTILVHAPDAGLSVAVLANDEGAEVTQIAGELIDAATGAP